jgi:cytochrome b
MGRLCRRRDCRDAGGVGFVGPRHARFSDLVRGPIVALVYLRDLLYGRARRYLGHSPAGGAMVIAHLVCLTATVTTGLVAYGEQGNGPLAVVLVTDANANGMNPGTGSLRRRAENERKALSANCMA